ncbi:hypothetical protein HPB47_025093 [Ixodes persulcatus]|uniref:Uncharacterized protein n=1 Tax=Ixodes persulcatus TaxID=34615 RepID=A0AC60Q4C6_IXOPE|nr:hypothetical protein HPB47_025093 [Ixodes persulcatus]
MGPSHTSPRRAGPLTDVAAARNAQIRPPSTRGRRPAATPASQPSDSPLDVSSEGRASGRGRRPTRRFRTCPGPGHRSGPPHLCKVVLVDGRQLRRVVVVIHRWLVARAKASRDTGLTSAFRSGRGLASLLSHGPGVRDGAALPRQRVFGPPATAWPQLAAVPSA